MVSHAQAMVSSPVKKSRREALKPCRGIQNEVLMADDSERRKEADRRYRLKHKDKIRASKQAWYEANKDRIREKSREYYRENKKKVAEYRREYIKRDSTKERQKVHTRAWKQKNPDKSVAYMKKYRKRRADWFLELKSGLKCSKCGQSFPDYPTVIDFHHTRGSKKEGRLSSMVTGNAPEERILAEIEKCIPVCANCHRKLHVDEKREKERKAKEARSKP
jgi:hypothetical protein